MTKILFNQGTFLRSSVAEDNFPNFKAPDGKPFPEIAIIGRSNVGKSSLINHLVRGPNLAKTSSTPGKTQMINFFMIDEKLLLVDLPGYGYAKVEKSIKIKWAEYLEAYLQNRSSLSLLLLLLDIRRTPTEEDMQLLRFATYFKKQFLLIFTKTDKVNDQERKKSMESSLKILEPLHNSSPIEYLYFSIKDPKSRDILIDKINNILQQGKTT